MDKTGFVAVVGRPNVGKSSLLNRIIGAKISIISNKPQTTRDNIQLIYSDQDSQIIFVDTPGMQKPKNKLGKQMARYSKSSVADMDLVLYLVDTSNYIGEHEEDIINFLDTVDLPIILGINKIDKISNEELLELIALYDQRADFDEIVPISAIENENIDRLVQVIKDYLPYGPRYYPDDQLTDKSNKFIIEEIIREKALKYLKEEVPHGIYVQMGHLEEKDTSVYIEASIYCEKESHKGIIIGKGGQMIKKIRLDSQKDIARLYEKKANLNIMVKVNKNWRDKESIVKKVRY